MVSNLVIFNQPSFSTHTLSLIYMHILNNTQLANSFVLIAIFLIDTALFVLILRTDRPPGVSKRRLDAGTAVTAVSAVSNKL